MTDFVKVDSTGPSLDTSALSAAATEFLNRAPEPAPVAEPVVAAAVPASPVEHTETPPAAEGGTPTAAADPLTTYADLPDDALVRLKVDGVEVVKPWKEARAEMMLHSKFTKEMQALRASQGEFETERTTLAEKARMSDQLSQLLTDDELLSRYIAQAKPALLARLSAQQQAQPAPAPAPAVPAAPGFNPEELATLGEARTLFTTEAQSLEQRFATRMEQELAARAEAILSDVDRRVNVQLQTIEDAREVSKYNAEIVKTIDQVITTNPMLKAIPNISDLMRHQVQQMQPRTPAEMLEAFEIVGRGMAEQLDAIYTESRKAQVVAAEKLTTAGIEPPTGSAPSTATPLTYTGADGKVSFDAIREQARAYMANR